MKVVERTPAEAWPLATFLVEEISARGWTTDDVARRMAAPGHVGEACLEIALLISVVDDRMVIADDTFENLARAFDVSAAFFCNLHTSWTRAKIRHAPEEAPDAIYGPITRYMIDSAGRAALKERDND